MCVSAYGTPTIEADRRTHFIARLDAAMDLFRRPARLFPAHNNNLSWHAVKV